MAEEHYYLEEPIHTAPMDYDEHRKTYSRFLWLVKYGTIAVVAILLGMLAGLIASWGILGSLFVAIAAFVILAYVLG